MKIQFVRILMVAFFLSPTLYALCPEWSTNLNGWNAGKYVNHQSKTYKVIQGGNAGISPEDPIRSEWKNYFEETVNDCIAPSSSSLPSSSSVPANSSATNSSSLLLSSSSTPDWLDTSWQGQSAENPFEGQSYQIWNQALASSTRCALDGIETEIIDPKNTIQHGQKCFFPDSLRGDTLFVPSNVTRFDPSAISLCSVVEKAPDSTVIMYVMDWSGSMSRNDPQKISDDAFEAGIQVQQLKDSSSHAGFLAFDDYVHSESEVLPGQLTALQMKNLTDKIEAKALSGTNYSAPLAKAAELMNSVKYLHWRKAIIFLTDGQPGAGTTSSKNYEFNGTIYNGFYSSVLELVEQEAFPPVYGIYLGNDTTSQGQKNKKFIEDFSAVSGGEGNHIKTANEMAPLIEKLLSEIISENGAVNVGLGNKNLNVIGSATIADSMSFKIQEDGSRKITLNKPIPLEPGLNQMVLFTQYKTQGKVKEGEEEIVNLEIPFFVQVSGSPIEDNEVLQDSLFKARCEEWNQIVLQGNETSIDYITSTDRLVKLTFRSKLFAQIGDTALVQILSLNSQRKSSWNLPYLKEENGFGVYSLEIPLYWEDQIQSQKGIHANAIDTFLVYWEHPNDPRDFAKGDALAFSPPPKIDSLEYFDVDHDGRLDSIHAHFAGPLYQSHIKELENQFTWLGAEGDTLEIKLQNHEIGKNEISWLIDEELAKSTFIDQSIFSHIAYFTPPAFAMEYTYPQPNLFIDRMSPIILAAELERNNLFDEANLGLIVHFSEAIDTANMPNEPWLLFDLYEEKGKIIDLSKNGKWLDQNQAYRVSFSEELKKDFALYPSDLVQFKLTTPPVEDLFGNPVHSENPKVLIAGDYDPKVYKSHLKSYSIQNELTQDSTIEIRFLNVRTPIESYLDNQNKTGISFGPLKVHQYSELVPSEIQWDFVINIFDHSGQFVFHHQSQIKCDDEKVFKSEQGDNCKNGDGKQMVFLWNHKSTDNQNVGTGIYLIQLIVNGKEKAIQKVGVKRQAL